MRIIYRTKEIEKLNSHVFGHSYLIFKFMSLGLESLIRQTGCETGYTTPKYGPRFISSRTNLVVIRDNELQQCIDPSPVLSWSLKTSFFDDGHVYFSRLAPYRSGMAPYSLPILFRSSQKQILLFPLTPCLDQSQ